VTADKRFHVTPEQAYDLVHAALSIGAVWDRSGEHGRPAPVSS
jgi:hypothetical protein